MRKVKMNEAVKKVLVSEQEIKEICERLGAQISKDYEGKELVVVGMLKGCAPFMMELIKHITIPMRMDFMQITSYHGGTESNTVVFKKDIEMNVAGKHVIIVDDIIDTGKTIMEVLNIFKTRRVASIELACLLDKPEGRVVDYNPKYVGTTIPKEFVIGYGLDFDELYRNLPFVGVLKEEYYQ